MSAGPTQRHVDPFAAGLLAAAAMVALSAALIPVRSWLGNSNIALVLVVGIVTAAAVGGRSAGIAGSAAAALSYNFFHTVPHYTLDIHDRVDRITTVLLLALGLLIGEIVVRTQRALAEADTRAVEVTRLRRTAHVASTSAPADLIRVLEDEIGDVLGLWFCRFQRGPLDRPLPRLTRQGVSVPPGVPPLTSDPNSWAVELPVLSGEREMGRFVLVPHEPDATGGFAPDARRDAIALADQLGAALASRSVDARRSN